MNIYCMSSDPAVGHGADELRRYAAKIAGLELDVIVVHRYEPGRPGFWLGLREQFGDVFPNPGLTHPMDDGFYIRSDGLGGLLLAGVNGRSVLYAVYAYLESLGCRWVRAGADGEVLPGGVHLTVDGYDVAEFPDYRYRGVCIEGGVSIEHALAMVDYMVKKRFNTYFIQFQNAYIFWSRWYDRDGEANTMPVEDAEAYTARLAAAVKARGLALQMVGHGWTCESLGQPGLGWIQTEMTLPPEKQNLLALVDGRRTWWKGVPIDTELCMSNPEAFRTLRDYIVSYALNHPEVDLLHVWLSDGWNNRCECSGCSEKRPSDWYVDLLNAVDEQLDAAGADTKIVFLAYADLLWAPEKSRLRREERFILMFAPLTRTWRTTLLGDRGEQGEADAPDVQRAEPGERPTPFRLNNNTFPTSTAVNVHYFREWKKQFAGDSFAFDYHLLWKHSIVEPTGLAIARVLYEDIRALDRLALQGLVNCQVQRCFFPTGLAMEVAGKTLWNKERTFDAVKRDYFAAAFGRHGLWVQRHLEQLSALLDSDLLFEPKPEADPAYEERVRKAATVLDRLAARVDAALAPSGVGPAGAGAAGGGAPDAGGPGVEASLRYLRHGIRFMRVLLGGFLALAAGEPAGLGRAYRAASSYLVDNEAALHTVCDTRMWQEWLETYAADYETPAEERDIV